MWRSGLSHKMPASILEVMSFLFFHFLNKRGRERDRSARILFLSSLQPMVSWRGIAESWKGKNPDYCAFPEIRNILESLVSCMKPGKKVPILTYGRVLGEKQILASGVCFWLLVCLVFYMSLKMNVKRGTMSHRSWDCCIDLKRWKHNWKGLF